MAGLMSKTTFTCWLGCNGLTERCGACRKPSNNSVNEKNKKETSLLLSPAEKTEERGEKK